MWDHVYHSIPCLHGIQESWNQAYHPLPDFMGIRQLQDRVYYYLLDFTGIRESQDPMYHSLPRLHRYSGIMDQFTLSQTVADCLAIEPFSPDPTWPWIKHFPFLGKGRLKFSSVWNKVISIFPPSGTKSP